MPLYEYKCRACTHQLEVLVRGSDSPPACPSCGQDDLERVLSMFAVSSASTRQANLRAAREKNKKAAFDKAVADREAIENHHH
jgi:putative FmdB family regulatory protein